MKIAPITNLYSILHSQVLPLAGDLLDSQLANLIRLMEGLFKGESVHLSRIANQLASYAQNLSIVRQLDRFLENGLVDGRSVYEPVARELLQKAAAVGRIVLILDSTKVGFSSQMMMVSLALPGTRIAIDLDVVGLSEGAPLDGHAGRIVEGVADLAAGRGGGGRPKAEKKIAN